MEAGIVQHRAVLIVVDSIAALARTEFGVAGSGSRAGGGFPNHQQPGIVERQEVLGLVASRLKYLAETFRIPVVVTNQVRHQRLSWLHPPDYGCSLFCLQATLLPP